MFLHRLEFDSSKIERLVNVVQENGGCPPSVEKAMHFRGSGYVKLNLSSSQIHDELQFRFRIRTSWPDGLLLAAFGNVSKDFLFVETRGRDGINVRYRTNEERVNVIRVNRCVLCDSLWHEIDLSITDRLIIVRVDNAEDEEVAHIINVRQFSLDILQNVYVGGLPQYDLSETRPTPVEVALGVGVNVTGYGGCLTNFSVNKRPIDVVKKREENVNVSFAGCPNFPWSGPVCEDQLVDIHSASGNESVVTDTSVEAFTEYLYRVVVNVSGAGGVVFSEWINVRTGNDSSSSGRFLPEIDDDGMGATIQWAGTPTVLQDKDGDSLYEIDIYTCTICLNTTIMSCSHWKRKENAFLPYRLSPAPSAVYTVKISASVLSRAEKLTSNFSTPVVMWKPEAHSNVCECSKDKSECVHNETGHSGCFSFNTFWCSTNLDAIHTMLECFCLSKTASSSYNRSQICQPPPSDAVNSTTGFATGLAPSSSYSDICPLPTVSSTTETTSSFGLPDAYLVGTGIGCFLVVIGVGIFFYWKKKRAPAASSNRNEVQMTAAVSSPFDEKDILLTSNACYSLLPPLSPPLPPPNETVDSEIDCIEKRDDAPFDAVNLEINRADVKNDKIDYEDPTPDDETDIGFTAASISVFWEPAKTEKTLHNQLAEAKVRC
ncbi:uncharacterized protein [Oscarella lobularis]|uniref:uncharacterized protein isoform X2 n=1 Tax=Oscarella lobularis TaxID=121494 RepID=UPI0033142B91